MYLLAWYAKTNRLNMSELDRIKMWLNEMDKNYEAIKRRGELMPNDQLIWDTYKTVQKKIEEIQLS